MDGLSERDPATQDYIGKILGDSGTFNALIITSRSEPRFGVTGWTTLFPLLLDTKRVVPFIVDYLARLETVEILQDGRAQLHIAQQILSLAELSGQKTPVTPLLVKLFVDSAVDRASNGLPLDNMPQVVPEVFIDYLHRLNSGDAEGRARVQNEDFTAAARALAELSLGENLVPSDFTSVQASEVLSRLNFRTGPEFLLDWLVTSGVIDHRLLGGISILRFSLDPVAEHLAAIRKIFSLRTGGRAAVDIYLNELVATDDYPSGCDGYLTAFAACYLAYHKQLRLPDIDFPWQSHTG